MDKILLFIVGVDVSGTSGATAQGTARNARNARNVTASEPHPKRSDVYCKL